MAEDQRAILASSRIARLAMIVGVLSGPISISLFVLAGNLNEPIKTWLAQLAFVLPLAAALFFAIAVMFKIAAPTRRDRLYTIIGAVAPIAWGIAIFILISAMFSG